MNDLPDHPIVAAMERDGLAPCQTPAQDPICPVCGRGCDTLFKSIFWQEVVGCDNCISRIDAYRINE